MDSKTAATGSAKVAFKVARTGLRVSAKVIRWSGGQVIEAVKARQAAERTAAHTDPAPADTPPPPASSPAPPVPAAETTLTESGEPIVAPSALPDTPLTEQEGNLKTIDDSDEVVGEYAEPGAEDGAGAQLDLAEPWNGYGSANVATIGDRIAVADAAEVAVIELYESAHKGRKGVLDAAAKRLKALSPSD